MGLYDRDYASQRGEARRGRSASGGRLSVASWTVTTWLIIVNSLVFFLQPMLANHPVAVLVEERLNVKNYPPNTALDPTPYHTDLNPVSPARPMRAGETLIQTLRTADGWPYIAPGDSLPIVANRFLAMDPISAYGHFSTYEGFLRMEVWRLVSFQFLHANLSHLFFNMLGLYMFGLSVEEYLGKKKYLAFYLTCGIFGGLMYMALNLLGMLWLHTGLPQIPFLLFENPATTLVGASAGVFGVIMACARIRPNDVVQMLFPPISIRMELFAYGYVLLALLNVVFNGNNAGGDAAHIGGALAGYFFIRNSHLLRDFFDVFADSRVGGKPRKLRLVDPEPPGHVDPDEIDRILAKVKDRGITSLTDDERKALEAERERHLRRAQ